MTVIAAAGPSPLWYLTRATGVVALLLLTASVMLGILGTVRWGSPRWPRFLTAGLHRNLSLLVLVLLAVHILTAILDNFAPIALKDAVVPFVAAYRPLWLGFGALAFDLLLVLAATSLLRRRLGYRAWRAVHWLAYASWPLALVHGLGSGSDAKLSWMVVLSGTCLAAVLLALWRRLAVGWRAHPGVRVVGLVASVAVPLVIVGWYAGGPGKAGWARRAGTPARLLASARMSPAPSSKSGGRTRPVNRALTTPSALPTAPFTASLRGSLRQSKPNRQGRVAVEIDATLGGGANGLLTLVLDGQPLPGGGVSMDTSQVSFGSQTEPHLYQGQIVSLASERLVAVVSGAGSLQLTIDLRVDRNAGSVAGSLHVVNWQGGTLPQTGDGDGHSHGDDDGHDDGDEG